MKRLLKYVALLLATTLVLSGCIFAATPPCDADADCVSGTFCAQGACVVPEDISCQDDRDCPNPTLCDRVEGFCFFP